MAYQTLDWTVNAERGTISFGRKLPITGNTYAINLVGTPFGSVFYVMDESGEVCLAKSRTEEGETRISLNTTDLRNQFDKNWHEIKNFHTVVSDGTTTLAEGDLMIVWNPVWTDLETGEAYSMRGPQGESVKGDPGEPGEPGPKGADAIMRYVVGEDGLYHEIIAVTNNLGETVLEIAEEGVETPEHDWATQEYARQAAETAAVREADVAKAYADTVAEEAKSEAIAASQEAVAVAEAAKNAALQATREAVAAKETAITKAQEAVDAAEEAKETAEEVKTTVVAEVINTIYPVGSIYIGTTETCPIAAIVGTWTKIEGRYLLASGNLTANESYTAGTEVAAGLPTPPNHTHSTTTLGITYVGGISTGGAFSNVSSKTGDPTWSEHAIYGQSETVRPKSYAVNVWRRTA